MAEGWSQWATSLGCHVSRVPPIGMESHRIEDNQIRPPPCCAMAWVHSEAGSTCRWVSGWAHFPAA